MFTDTDYDSVIPPNFLNSILTNPSLYEMFKTDFDNNTEYFGGIPKNAYQKEMLRFIEDTLFSSNIFHIYSEPEDIELLTKGKLSYIKNFYDDFLLEEFKKSPESILKIRLFRGLVYTKMNDLYASKTIEFHNLFDYIFHESLDYFGITSVLTKDALNTLHNKQALSLKDFDIVCNYVKNNIDGFITMDLVECLLYNHAFKLNHIFDAGVAEAIVQSLLKDYMGSFGIDVIVKFENGLDSKELSSHDADNLTIHLDESLINSFCMMNYVELFEHVFYEADVLKDIVLIKRNEANLPTLRALMNMILCDVDLDDLILTQIYINDLKASSFVKSLRLFRMFGVNLFDSYINSKIKSIDTDDNIEIQTRYSKKEISIDQRFNQKYKKLPNKDKVRKYISISLLYNDESSISTIDLIKSLNKSEYKDYIINYLHSRVISPEEMVQDVNAFVSYRPKDEWLKEFIQTELKYFYVDAFFYSVDSYLKLNYKKNLEDYLDDLLFKVNCIKETPLTHRFKDEAIFTITEAKQNLN